MRKSTEDALLLAFCNVEGIELTDEKGLVRVFLISGLQGRVITSAAAGSDGDSFGWINRGLIRSGEVRRQFNPRGGEERFGLGPQGGPYSLYFALETEQIYEY